MARDTDLEATYQVYLAANQDLNQRIGRKVDLRQQTLPTRALAVRRNALEYDRERFWVAESGKSIVGFGLATRRPSYWYLAALHVMPEFQGQGVGGMLIRRCLGDLDSNNPVVPLLTTSDSANLGSTGLYMRRGLLPQDVIVQLEGRTTPFGSEGVALRQTDWMMGQEECNRMDQFVFGTSRSEDHLGWAKVPKMVLYLAYLHQRVIGYVYVDTDGALGPAAVDQPELLAPTISTALSTYAPDRTAQVQIRVPGIARDCLAALFSAGFGITEIRLLLSSRSFGQFDRYLPSGADALF